MSYPLANTVVDEVAITGTFISSGKKWANVFKGIKSSANPATSADLLNTLFVAWQTQTNPLFSNDVKTSQLTARQIIGYDSEFGHICDFTPTLSLGSIAGGTIVIPGAGYLNGVRNVAVLDNGPGLGATLNLTFTGGSLTSIAPGAPGSGYVAPFCRLFLPDDPGFPEPNALKWTYGASDFLLVTNVGGVATDRATSFNAYSIRLRSAQPGRFGRSAAHWPGVPEADTTLDALTNSAAVTAAATAIYGSLLSITGAPATWHAVTLSKTQALRTSLPPNINPSPLASNITTVACNVNVGSMLRRKVKV